MGIRDMAGKAKDAIGEDRAQQGVDAAAEKLDEVTGGKYDKQTDQAADAASKGVDRAFGDEDQAR